MKTIAVLNGPNLDRLGKREPEIYGHETLQDLTTRLESEAAELGLQSEHFQSNHEGELIDKLSAWANEGEVAGLIFNAAGLTHTSISLRDAIAASKLPSIEVHISNIYQREEFRHKSFTAPIALGIISGLGLNGYSFALQHLAQMLKK